MTVVGHLTNNVKIKHFLSSGTAGMMQEKKKKKRKSACNSKVR